MRLDIGIGIVLRLDIDMDTLLRLPIRIGMEGHLSLSPMARVLWACVHVSKARPAGFSSSVDAEVGHHIDVVTDRST